MFSQAHHFRIDLSVLKFRRLCRKRERNLGSEWTYLVTLLETPRGTNKKEEEGFVRKKSKVFPTKFRGLITFQFRADYHGPGMQIRVSIVLPPPLFFLRGGNGRG